MNRLDHNLELEELKEIDRYYEDLEFKILNRKRK